jgi:hypothetical protein
LPGGRAATERYLHDLSGRDPTAAPQFPAGTMVAMARRALTVDRANKVRVTPVTELVQTRVYRRIPEGRRANMYGDFREQDVYEFALDRQRLFAGEHGLRAVGPEEPFEPLARREGDPFVEEGASGGDPGGLAAMPALKTCIQCHQAPGIESVLSIQRALPSHRHEDHEIFRTYAWDVEMKASASAKVGRYDWGLLQGSLEANK